MGPGFESLKVHQKNDPDRGSFFLVHRKGRSLCPACTIPFCRRAARGAQQGSKLQTRRGICGACTRSYALMIPYLRMIFLQHKQRFLIISRKLLDKPRRIAYNDSVLMTDTLSGKRITPGVTRSSEPRDLFFEVIFPFFHGIFMRFAMFRCIVPYFPQNGFEFFFLEFASLFYENFLTKVLGSHIMIVLFGACGFYRCGIYAASVFGP